MKIVKPLAISPLTRVYRMHGQEHLGVAALMVATLGDTPKLLAEAELWRLAGDELRGYTLDMALPKACPEFLVSGYAYGRYANDSDAGACEVGIRIAGVEKRLRVSGDRQWAGARITAPQPFERLPIDWDRAYGGADCADNPRGRGAHAREGAPRDLPNIEYAHSPMRFPDERPTPAGFCPIDATWPERAALYGELDQQWREEDCPGFPRTLDPRYFNIAPSDQQLPGRVEFPDGATYALTHLHPERARLAGSLPALRARSFVVRNGSDMPEEIPMRLTTAWFVPHRERVLLIYHGVTVVRAFDASDVQTVLFGADASGHARPLDWYRQVIEWRTRHDKAALYALRDQDLLPEHALQPDVPAMADAMPQSVRQRQLRERLSVFPDAPQAQTPSPGRLAEFVERQEALADEKRAALEAMRHELATSEVFSAGRRRGPPARTAPVEEDGTRHAGASSDPPGIRQIQRDADERLRELYRRSAQHQDAPARLNGAAAQSRREFVAAAAAAGRSLEGVDLTGADLSGMDLRGARLAGAMLENADLSGADLTGAVLSRAVLVRANLARTKLVDADLTAANLSLADCEQTDFSGADSSDGIFERVHLRDCRFNGGLLANTRFDACRFDAVDFGHAVLRDLIFIEQSFDSVSFSDATIRKMLLMNCPLADVRFSSASIDGFGIVGAQASGQLRFDRASMSKACFVAHCDIGRADFSFATLTEVNFREARLGEASFRGARIGSCDFTDACLRAADFRGAKAQGSHFVRADFTRADLRDTDLIAAYLRGATLDGADLRRANLFRANLSQILADAETRWEDAYLGRAVRFPLAQVRT
ncbi:MULTISPECIES: DUF2169 domain-containing protein [unclassified Burkholderia]|uniref:DUF2169 family type VI secretion system accessory protein n=1 Tax=unclassified Burkholderia TaxID=2613784 RepID=UPI000757C837|nr:MULTISPECIES: DUF2169 domain-containing protein [unclassified Burkholderia]KVN06703.1 hypothetical protein WT08_19665 [Burkholderia sp. MSMB1552]KWZ50074.1 hypothetical protein WS92_21720 [Burkholderia sp. MSMB1588]